jgi:hypothetical protein
MQVMRVWSLPAVLSLTGAFAQCSSAVRSLGCADSQWIVPDGALKCSTFGSESYASELVGSGSSACAHQELQVVSNLPYQVSGGIYALATCTGTCKPLVVVCPGQYTGELHQPAPVIASVAMLACPFLFTVSQLRFADLAVGVSGWLLSAPKCEASCAVQTSATTAGVAYSTWHLRARTDGRRLMGPLLRPST